MKPFGVNETRKMIAADGMRLLRIIIIDAHSSTSQSSHPLLQSLRESVFQSFMCLSLRIPILTTNK